MYNGYHRDLIFQNMENMEGRAKLPSDKNAIVTE